MDKHMSDCAVHNGPAYEAGECDCAGTEYWYFTFMQKQEGLRNSYTKIKGSYEETRQRMNETFGNRWAFQYSEEEFLPQIEKYGLVELKGLTWK